MSEHEKINGHTGAPRAESDQPGKFFGMKILFSKPVGLYPVKVDSQAKRSQNKNREKQNGAY